MCRTDSEGGYRGTREKTSKISRDFARIASIAARLKTLDEIRFEPDLGKATVEKVEKDFKATFVIKEVPFATQQRNQEVFRPSYSNRLTAEELEKKEKFVSKDKELIDLFKKQTNERNAAKQTIYRCCSSSDNVSSTDEQQAEFGQLMKSAERSLSNLQLPMNSGIQQQLFMYNEK